MKELYVLEGDSKIGHNEYVKNTLNSFPNKNF